MPEKSFVKNKLIKYFRYIMLGAILIFITSISFFHQQDEVKFPPVDSLCPFGALESLYSIIFKGRFIERIFSSSLILLIITIILVFASGRSFCGWICPLGAIQGMANSISMFFIKKPKILFLEKDKYIRKIRYAVLIIFTAGAWMGGRLLIRPYDPWAAWMHLSVFKDAIAEFLIGLIILLAVILLSFFISRNFCRYLCPMGAFLGLINKISPFSIKRDKKTCNNCQLCDRACPVAIKVSQSGTMNKTECISCGECAAACNKKHSISFQYEKLAYNMPPLVLPFVVFTLFFGTIGTTKLFGLYRSRNYSIEELKNKKDLRPEDIKGYMTLREVSEIFKLDLALLYEELKLDINIISPNIKCKEIQDIIGMPFETDDVRVAVGTLLNIPEDQIQKSCSVSDSTDAAFIAGTMTLEQVSINFNIPLDELYKELGLSENKVPKETQCRELKNIVSPSFHTTKVREAVARILAKKN